MTRLEEFLNRKRAEYGVKFDPSDLSEQFAGHFNTQQRIKVDFVGLDDERNDVYGHTLLTGTVSVTGGWKPSFMLMRTKRSASSSWLLSDRDKIVSEVR